VWVFVEMRTRSREDEEPAGVPERDVSRGEQVKMTWKGFVWYNSPLLPSRGPSVKML